ncbi:MAG: type IV pilus assembly protein PilM [Thermoleophilia bacterium]
MASFFKKKSGKDATPGGPLDAGAGRGDVRPPLPPKPRKKLFGGKGISMPTHKKSGKKGKRLKSAPFPGEKRPKQAKPERLVPPPPTADQASAEAKEGGENPSTATPPPEKKSLFGRKGPRVAKEPQGSAPAQGARPAQDKPPQEKKQRQKMPREAKPPREKKPRKPLFGAKKKASSGPPAPAGVPAAYAVPPAKPRRERKPLFTRKTKESAAKEPTPPKQKAAHPKKGGAGFGSRTSPVGLDLGRSSVTAVRLRHQTSGSMILQVALDSLPEGLIQEGEVRDVEGLAFAIREFWKTYKIKGRKVSLGLANQKIVVRSLDFPMLDGKELRSAIEFQAQDYIPIPIDEAVFDYHILGSFTDEDGVQKQKVLVVAAQKNMVMDFINAIKKARLQVASVDLQAFALLRSMVTRSFLDEGSPAGSAVAVANIASDVTNLVVDVAGEPQFTRIISFGGDDFTKAVQEQLNINFADAEVMKAQIGLPAPGRGAGSGENLPAAEGAPEADTQIIPPFSGENMPDEGEPAGPGGPPESGAGGGSPFGANGLSAGGGEPPSPQRGEPDLFPPTVEPGGPEGRTREENVQRALEITTEALADEIRRSLDYYMSQEKSIPIGKLLLSGGGAMLPNLDAQLSQVFPFNVEMGNPLTRVTLNKSGLSDEDLRALAPRLAISIGLSLEDEG